MCLRVRGGDWSSEGWTAPSGPRKERLFLGSPTTGCVKTLLVGPREVRCRYSVVLGGDCVQLLCSQTLKLPLGCVGDGPGLRGLRAPDSSWAVQGSLGAGLEGLPAPRGLAAPWACVTGLGSGALVSTSAAAFHAGDMSSCPSPHIESCR